VWLYFGEKQHLNHWVDITETIEQKIQALAAHASQLGEWATNGGMRDEVLKWASETATRHNLRYKYTEGFQRIVLSSDEDQPPEAKAVEAQV
jgi:LmbE family N-acetylglucosaminyl deacetylase